VHKTISPLVYKEILTYFTNFIELQFDQKIFIAINRAIKIFHRDYSRLIAPEQETQVRGIE